MNKNLVFKIKNLSFKFDDDSYFFKNMFTEFDSNQINFVTGDNGIGKSTFFRILLGKTLFGEKVSGKCFLEKNEFNLEDIYKQKQFIQKVKIVSQKVDDMIADKFSFEKNIEFANLQEKPSLKFLRSDKKDIISFKDLNINFKKPVGSLSGGQKQILSIVMALQKNAKILLLDEPTASLDIKNTGIVMDFLNKLIEKSEIIILIICHDKQIINKYVKTDFFEIIKIKNNERKIIKKELNLC